MRTRAVTRRRGGPVRPVVMLAALVVTTSMLRGLPEHFDQFALLHLHQFTERLLAINELDDMLAQFADRVLALFAQAERVSASCTSRM